MGYFSSPPTSPAPPLPPLAGGEEKGLLRWGAVKIGKYNQILVKINKVSFKLNLSICRNFS
jgi:hypothetical protein